MAVFRNLILDWSGTLVDDFRPVLEATNEIFRQYGKSPMSADEFRDRFRLPFTEFYRDYLPEATLPEIDHHYHTAFKLLQADVALLPGAVELLEYSKQRAMNLFLLSTIHAEHFRVQGQRLGIASYFKQAYVQEMDKRKAIHRLLAEHDLDPHETIFVGDMQHDIEAARHGGVVSCAVLTGYDTLAKLRAANPDLIFRSLTDFRGFLDRHRGEPDYFPLATVGALIFNGRGEVLMIRTHKWSYRWGIPGGKIKTNETALDALRREVMEETGLEIEDVRFQMVQDCIQPPEFYKQAHFLLLNYTARVVGPCNVRLNDEAESFQWLPLAETFRLDLNTPTRILVDHVRSHSNS